MSRGVLIQQSYYDAFNPMSDSDRLLMYDAILRYGFDGIEPNLPAYLAGYFTLARPNIDSSARRYEAASENGKKGGRPKKSSAKNQMKNQSGNQSGNQTHNLNSNFNSNFNSKSDKEEEFEAFWSAYPRKADKKRAKAAFVKAKAPLDVLLSAIETQKRSQKWIAEAGRFIPLPTTWLNGERWLDEVQPAPVKSSSGWEILPVKDYTAPAEEDR